MVPDEEDSSATADVSEVVDPESELDVDDPAVVTMPEDADAPLMVAPSALLPDAPVPDVGPAEPAEPVEPVDASPPPSSSAWPSGLHPHARTAVAATIARAPWPRCPPTPTTLAGERPRVEACRSSLIRTTRWHVTRVWLGVLVVPRCALRGLLRRW